MSHSCDLYNLLYFDLPDTGALYHVWTGTACARSLGLRPLEGGDVDRVSLEMVVPGVFRKGVYGTTG